MLIGQVIKKMSNSLPVFDNLCLDSSFENLDNWVVVGLGLNQSSVDKYHKDYSIYTTGGGIRYHDFDCVNGNKYYISAYVKITNYTSGDLLLRLFDGSSYKANAIKSSLTDGWVKVSAISTQLTSNSGRVYVWGDGTFNAFIDTIMVVDLTANNLESKTLAELDALITYSE